MRILESIESGLTEDEVGEGAVEPLGGEHGCTDLDQADQQPSQSQMTIGQPHKALQLGCETRKRVSLLEFDVLVHLLEVAADLLVVAVHATCACMQSSANGILAERKPPRGRTTEFESLTFQILLLFLVAAAACSVHARVHLLQDQTQQLQMATFANKHEMSSCLSDTRRSCHKPLRSAPRASCGDW